MLSAIPILVIVNIFIVLSFLQYILTNIYAEHTRRAVAIVISLTGLSFYCELLVHDCMLIFSSNVPNHHTLYRVSNIFDFCVCPKKLFTGYIKRLCSIFYSITSKRIVYLNNIRAVYQVNSFSTP